MIYGEVEERFIPLVYCLMSKADKPSYVLALEVIKKAMVEIIEETQGERAVGVGRPARESTQSLKMKNSRLVMLDFEPPQAQAFSSVFGCKVQGC